MCGIIGGFSTNEASNLVLNSLKSLQHRGQQAAGIATMDGNRMHLKKGLGLIKTIITKEELTYLVGNKTNLRQ